MSNSVHLDVPIRVTAEGNRRDAHWGQRQRRTKQKRRDIRIFLNLQKKPALPVTVRLIRIAPDRLDGHDNLRTSMKAFVDEIAAWLGVASDDDPSVTWQYDQFARGKEYALQVAITPRGIE